tara:strand:- start:336 stop:509 length:174 start_codon:yes stop_codon:yes gene_type:complete
MSKPLTEKEKRAVIAELGYQTEHNEYDALHKLIDSLPPESLRDYISDVREAYGVDDE